MLLLELIANTAKKGMETYKQINGTKNHICPLYSNEQNLSKSTNGDSKVYPFLYCRIRCKDIYMTFHVTTGIRRRLSLLKKKIFTPPVLNREALINVKPESIKKTFTGQMKAL